MTALGFSEINLSISTHWGRLAERWRDKVSEQFDREHLHSLHTALADMETEASTRLVSLQQTLADINALENSL